MKLTDTIAAVSTPRGKGGVAMIRISGQEAFSVGEKVFRLHSGIAFEHLSASKLYRGDIIISEGGRQTVIDDGMVSIFRAPASFTGEDTVEIYCHGGILVTERVLSAVLMSGARHAEAGEFTRRSFVSGKLTLSEAESLGGLLEAKSFSQLRLARNGMSGHLSDRIEEAYDSLRSVMSGIYAAIDFPDEDLNEYSRDEIIELVSESVKSIRGLCSTYRTGRAVAEGIPTVICGRANAGKSSLYNAIVGYDAAIVTDIEGTTRDVLRQSATLGVTTLLLSDTAGLRETADKVEEIGIERTYREIDCAELVLAVFDGASELTADDEAFIDYIKDSGKTCVAIINKSDLNINSHTQERLCKIFKHCILMCAAKCEGMDRLAVTVDGLYIDGSIDIDNDAVVAGARQYSSLCLAAESLEEVLGELSAGTPLDLCSAYIESAMSSLCELDGRQIGEEIVSEIFSKFCVGK